MITPERAMATYHAGPEAVVRMICDLSSHGELLQKRVEELEIKVAKLAKNSSNSSKPPSSDIVKPKPRRQPGKGKIGAQPGHPRHERTPFPEEGIAQFHHYRLECCPDCGDAGVIFLDQPPRVHQQMDIKEVIVRKEEHRSYPVWCESCKKIHYHPFPESVVKEGLFKERLTALVAYMKAVLHASFSTIRKFIRDVMGETVSRGYLRKVIEKVTEALEAPYEELLGHLPFEHALNVDETGHKDNGKRLNTWVFRADLYVLFKIETSRGSDVLIKVLGKEFNGVLGCDYFSAYHKYMKDFNVTVQFCIAHLIRELKFMTGVPDRETRAYGWRILDEVRAMFKVIHERDQTDPAAFQLALEEARERIMVMALNDVPSRLDRNAKELNRAAFNMAKRFRDNGEAYFRFITTPGIGPTNNLAEQAVRFIVIDRHITQGTRGLKGQKTCERLWTVVGTCAMQGRSAFDFIHAAVHAHFHNKPAPSLLPAAG